MEFNIEKFLSLDGYDTEVRKSRRKSGISSQEFFTPYSIVKKMCDKIPESDWADPDKIFLEPSMGNGQFILMILFRRIHEYGIPWQKALENVFGIELMPDNVIEARQRVHELLRNIAPDYSPKVANQIMDKNFVCSDFFKWDFENWCPIEEKKKSKPDATQLEINFD